MCLAEGVDEFLIVIRARIQENNSEKNLLFRRQEGQGTKVALYSETTFVRDRNNQINLDNGQEKKEVCRMKVRARKLRMKEATQDKSRRDSRRRVHQISAIGLEKYEKTVDGTKKRIAHAKVKKRTWLEI
jgi:hypothetical protein